MRLPFPRSLRTYSIKATGKKFKRTPPRHSAPPFELLLLKIRKVLKLEDYVKEGRKALVYMDRCHQSKHVPSAPSLQSLEDTLIRVYEASNIFQVRESFTSESKKRLANVRALLNPSLIGV